METSNKVQLMAITYYVVFNVILSNGCYFADYYTVNTTESRDAVRIAALEAYRKAPNEVLLTSSIFYKNKVNALKINVYTEEEYNFLLTTSYQLNNDDEDEDDT